MNARFVTFEGIEGSGKTMQMRLLKAELERRGTPFLLTREPGGTPLGEDIRDILLRHDGTPPEPPAELLLYLADRYQHLHQVIEPALASGRHVFSDRYHDATVVYQGYARGIGWELVNRIAELLQLRRPDLTLVLDLPVDVGLGRARRRNAEEDSRWGRFEEESREFHERVREGYHRLSKEEPDRVLLVDASDEPDVIFARVLQILEDRKILDAEAPVTP